MHSNVAAEHQQWIAELLEEVHDLQTRLDQLHATDVNSLRRAYRSLSQHVDALQPEVQAVAGAVQDIEPEVFTAEFVARQLMTPAAIATVVLWVAHRLLALGRVPARQGRVLRGGLAAATVAAVGWRWASSSVSRFAKSLRASRARRRAARRQVVALQERVGIMAALTSSLQVPGISRPASSAALAPAGAGGGGGGERAAGGAGSSDWERAGFNGDSAADSLSPYSGEGGVLAPGFVLLAPAVAAAAGSGAGGAGRPPPAMAPHGQGARGEAGSVPPTVQADISRWLASQQPATAGSGGSSTGVRILYPSSADRRPAPAATLPPAGLLGEVQALGPPQGGRPHSGRESPASSL